MQRDDLLFVRLQQAYARHEHHLRSGDSAALDEIDRIQKEIDDYITNLRQAAPAGSRWAT